MMLYTYIILLQFVMWYMNNIIITYWVYIVYGPSFPNLFTIVFRGRGWSIQKNVHMSPHAIGMSWGLVLALDCYILHLWMPKGVLNDSPAPFQMQAVDTTYRLQSNPVTDHNGSKCLDCFNVNEPSQTSVVCERGFEVHQYTSH